jgi:iron complex outermembrane receptor protein
MNIKKVKYVGVSAIALTAAISSPALAQTAEAQKSPTGEVEAIIVTGTRQAGIKAVDSAAPIQVIGSSQLTKTGSTDLASILQVAVPSFNTQTNGGDAAGVHVLAALRGLSPDDTLILVDGKRRHTTSNLAVDTGSVYSGSASVDLNYIPSDAIDRVEVLTDGASALYGSDAVAGVVNVILKKNSSGGYVTGLGGSYYNGQGLTGQWAYHQGFSFGEDKGFFDMTLEARYHDFSTLGFGDSRCQNANGTPTNSSTCPASMAAAAPNSPHENRVNGDPQTAVYNSFFNTGYNITPDIQVYGFGNLSYNSSQHFENYRTGYAVGGCTATMTGNTLVLGSGYSTSKGTCATGTPVYPAPNGFDPKEQFNETDYSFTGGVNGQSAGWHWDLYGTYGGNHTQVNVLDTDNTTVFENMQSISTAPVLYPIHTLYDGSFDATELTGGLDVTKSFETGIFAAPLDVAFGLEGRRDTFGISAGEPESYIGTGAQSFAGYTPADSGSFARTNYAGYLDFATNPIKNLKLDIAGRFEHFSDFGDAKTGKVTLRYDFSDAIALRGTISDGFRAPTLAEEYYSGLNVGPTSVSDQLPPDSAAAQKAGFPALNPEQSINYSAGLVLHPIPRLQITIDAYHILLTDRILPSASFNALAAECVPNGTVVPTLAGATVTLTCPAGKTAENVILSQSILSAVQNQGVTIAGLTSVGLQAFMNAVNTGTDGVDLTATYASDFGNYGHVDWSVGFNYNHTYVTSVQALPPAVAITDPAILSLGVQQSHFLNQISQSQLTTAQPREKAILQGLWTKGPWSVNLRSTIYADMSQFYNYPTLNKNVLETIPPTAIFDLDVAYKLNSHVKFNVGANNLFDTKPPITPLGSTGQPIDGNRIYNLPYSFAPWGGNGGYYYGRITLTF